MPRYSLSAQSRIWHSGRTMPFPPSAGSASWRSVASARLSPVLSAAAIVTLRFPISIRYPSRRNRPFLLMTMRIAASRRTVFTLIPSLSAYPANARTAAAASRVQGGTSRTSAG